MSQTGYDCVEIPGAANTAGARKASRLCGRSGGLVTASGKMPMTVCSKCCQVVYTTE